MKSSIILLAAALLASSACFPIPVSHQRLPRAQGTLIDQGKPLAGIDVAYVWGRGDCVDPVQKTVTDAEGRFAFEGDRYPVTMVALVPMAQVGWHVCFDKGTYWYGEYTAATSPAEVKLDCDMRARPVCKVERQH